MTHCANLFPQWQLLITLVEVVPEEDNGVFIIPLHNIIYMTDQYQHTITMAIIIWVMLCFNFSLSRAVIDVLTDVWDRAAVCISARSLPIDLTIFCLTRLLMDSLSTGTIDFCVKISVEVFVIVVIVAPFAVSSAAGVCSDAIFLVNIVVGVMVNGAVVLCTRSVCTPVMTALDASDMLISSKEALVFGWEVCSSCWATADWTCRSLQTRMPSCHVWPRFEFPALPQSPNQEPSCPQQLSLPDFFTMPHSGQTGLKDLVVIAGVGI